ncbi:MAG: hypothetical protein AB7O97_03005 [Planctomycetota bacterium]
MRRAIFTVASISAPLLLAACAIPRTVDRLQGLCPPPEFGRPGWVRACAGTGAWVGGIVGGVVSVVLLPVTYPLSLLCDDGLGEASAEELMFFPAVGGAAAGHFLFGGPPDLIDHVFRRAWFEEPQPQNTYELVPMEPPRSPDPAATESMPTEAMPTESRSTDSSVTPPAATRSDAMPGPDASSDGDGG